MDRRKLLFGLAAASSQLHAQKTKLQEWKPIFNGQNLDGWQVHGQVQWSVVDGVLVGRSPRPSKKPFGEWPITEQQYRSWVTQQAWLYTEAEFEQFDLQLEYWIPEGGNSGVSIRDSSRGDKSYGVSPQVTPAHIGYEIQIIDDGVQPYPSGSIYKFAAAPKELHKRNQWNKLEIESRKEMIRTRLNGKPAAEFVGDPQRPNRGPIGLQLHDRYSLVMFRNIAINVH